MYHDIIYSLSFWGDDMKVKPRSRTRMGVVIPTPQVEALKRGIYEK